MMLTHGDHKYQWSNRVLEVVGTMLSLKGKVKRKQAADKHNARKDQQKEWLLNEQRSSMQL
jgi:hypothetical protein